MLEIKVEDVSYRYKGSQELALNSIDLNIKSGSCLGLIGPNGAGKSTLLSILSGLLEPSAGIITFLKQQKSDLSKQQFIKQQIALVPQEYAFYNQLSVLQNLQYFISLCGLKTTQKPATIDKVIGQCQLQDVLKQKASALSGGYKRRLNLAIALLKDPQILYLDEPTVGVDPVSRNAILELIGLLKKQGKTIIFTSHMLSEIQSHCDEIFILKKGRAINFAQTEEHKSLQIIFSQPLQTAFKVELMAGITIEQNKILKCTISSENLIWEIMGLIEEHALEIESMQYGQHSLTEHYLTLMAEDDIAEH
ncbi:ABC transporter ATP-binding protein [Paraglaciecola sp. L3A3]|uniref:ABC transporter ATP-binding protein n=1 Tax=Paraglaciecola sp. L3A3 TaxID=2686358 RepID=UPI00131DBE19|nr:ABC transporter ATP-binding protein [Paraglaciecola sp. L3A3]